MKRAIITGATGSVGYGLVCELINQGYEVAVLTRKESKRNKYIPKSDNVSVYNCALSELKSFALEKKEYDVFFHLGWEESAGNGRNDVDLQYRNIRYTLDAVDLAMRLKCKTFVGVGSQAECGRGDGKIGANTCCSPENAYGAAKLAAGHLSRIQTHSYNMKHIWIRLLTVYGPFDKSGLVVPTMKKVIAGEVPAFTKGEQIWDFLYYKDVANALRLLAENGYDGKVYTLGFGKEKRLADYIKEMNRVILPDVEFLLGEHPYAENQIMYLCSDNSEVEKDVGWKPKTDFSDGIRELFDYIRNNVI